MAVQEIAVDLSLLASDIEELRENLSELRKYLEVIFTDMEELDTMWDGPANEQFQLQFTQDHQAMADMCDTIEAIIESYDYAKSEYTTCENGVYDTVTSIDI